MAAIKIAGSDDPKKIKEALWSVDFMGLNGPIKFVKQGPAGKESGQSKPNVYMIQISNGKVVILPQT